MNKNLNKITKTNKNKKDEYKWKIWIKIKNKRYVHAKIS